MGRTQAAGDIWASDAGSERRKDKTAQLQPHELYASPDQTQSGRLNQETCDRRGMWHVCGRREMRMFLAGKPKGKNHLEDLDIDKRILLLLILKKQDGRLRTGIIWLKTGKNGGLLLTR
jgi:hypothetical protein